jgi:pimeloyl-ACP methyl ester carboxylesterase
VGFVVVIACSCGSEPAGQPDGGAGVDAGLVGLVDAAGSVDAEAQADAAPEPPLVWGACDTADWPDGYWLPPEDTECATVEVPLDAGDPAGPSLGLRVARQAARSWTPRGAVFVLEGGPGGASVFTSGLIPSAMPDLQNRFDVIYVDQRGTGASGYLGCPGSPRTETELIECARQHTDTGLEHYLSLDVVRDLDLVRERLGYEEIYLFAVSYGTRIAFDYIRLHGDRVAAAILDGVAPPPVDLFSDTVTAADRGVDMLVRDCNADVDCLAVSPDLAADLETRRGALREEPRSVLVAGRPAQETEDDYVSLLKAFIRQSYWRYRVPSAVHEAVGGNDGPWNGLMSEAMGAPVTDAAGTSVPRVAPEPLRRRLPADSFGAAFGSPAVNMAMMCAEILPNSPGVAALADLYAEQSWADGLVLEKARACASWPVQPLDAAERQLVASDVAILLVSGAIDVNVDPRWATIAREPLNNAAEIVVPYSTHLATYVPCVGRINTDFLAARGDMTAVDTGCLQQLRQPPWE